MTEIDCAWVRDRAAELALGVLHGAERAEGLLHTAGCARCQALLTELTEVADALPLAVPEAEPPKNFGRQVVAAIRGDRSRNVRRWVAALAATAAAAAILSITVVRVVDAGNDGHPAAVAPSLRSVEMIGGDGRAVGRVVVGGHRPAELLVNVDYVIADGRYRLELRKPGAAPESLGTIDVADGHGKWKATSIDERDGSTLAMVDATGKVVCSAVLPATSAD